MSLKEKIDLVSKDNRASNCTGTAFFLLGLQKKDIINPTHEEWGYIDHKDFKKTPSKEYYIAIWTDKMYYIEKDGEKINSLQHIGIIVNLDPILVAHRLHLAGPFFKNQPIEEIIEIYGDNINYYRLTIDQ